jgi:4-amino-4-deoxy-L-arabinose transferase-like glycosyltransferase
MKKLIKIYSGLNIYYRLLPFLIVYIAITILFPKDEVFSDQKRYLWFADNLLHGFYSPPFPDINLWNGPGYPLFLAFFQLLKFSVPALRILNAFLLYFSLVLSYKTMVLYCSKKNAFLFTFLLGLYFPIFDSLRILMTECLSWFLVSLTCYSFLSVYKQKVISWRLILLSGFALAYLCMTKVIFGYVIPVVLIISIFASILPGFRTSAKKSIVVFSTAFIFCLPWLFYTFNLTHKIFYWSNSGSMSLYTMSSPFPDESGQWHMEEQLAKNPNHAAFMDSILKLTPLEREEAYKKQAVINIKTHPGKYLTNIVSNTGQLLFFPSDLAPDTIFAYIPFIPNMFIVVFIVLTLSASLVYYRYIPKEVVFLTLFILIYLSGSLFVTAYRRMFHITMPFWFFFFAYIFSNLISVSINKAKPVLDQ